MVLNFVMVVKFPNSSEIRNGSEMEWPWDKRYGSDIFRMVPKFRNNDSEKKLKPWELGRGKLIISLIFFLFSCHRDSMATVDGNPRFIFKLC